MSMRRNITFACIVSLSLTACAKSPAVQNDFAIKRADGSVVHFKIETAQNDAERERGLMGRESLNPDQGMVFVFPKAQVLTFWMKNTPLFLDMIFMDATGQIVYIQHKARPYDETLITSHAPAQYVLEIKGGEADAQHIAVGDRGVF